MTEERYAPEVEAPMGWPSPPVDVPDASDNDDEIEDDDDSAVEGAVVEEDKT